VSTADVERRPSIETSYRGYTFRSRLEARWAVFFDSMGISFSYENHPVHTSLGAYLPDFLLALPNGTRVIVEVKPLGMWGGPEIRKVEEASEQIAHEGVVSNGDPLDFLEWMRGGDGYAACDNAPYLFCVCPRCGAPGFEFEGRSHRIHGVRRGNRLLYGEQSIVVDRAQKARRYRFDGDRQ